MQSVRKKGLVLEGDFQHGCHGDHFNFEFSRSHAFYSFLNNSEITVHIFSVIVSFKKCIWIVCS